MRKAYKFHNQSITSSSLISSKIQPIRKFFPSWKPVILHTFSEHCAIATKDHGTITHAPCYLTRKTETATGKTEAATGKTEAATGKTETATDGTATGWGERPKRKPKVQSTSGARNRPTAPVRDRGFRSRSASRWVRSYDWPQRQRRPRPSSGIQGQRATAAS